MYELPLGYGAGRTAAREGGVGEGTSEGAALLRDVKLLPFYGPEGEVVGARVTGVRPGSWFQKMGVQPGDVVEGVDGDAVTSPSELRRRLGSGRLPKELRVRRSRGKRTSHRTLKG